MKIQSALLREGEDYYWENGLMVFTAVYLKKRNSCCKRSCRHCPYGFKAHKTRSEKSPE
ncbi:MAG: hypothetical protein JNJ65_16385 [Cyclobacteriaceae bacterium]|nr:hypothetical protein [Cyclobacteriaceae bacterium]